MGYKIRLEAGRRYIATRPGLRRGVTKFPIHITELGNNSQGIEIVDVMPYEKANAFLAAFNNGRTSFEGRVW